jgi:hypothetical protein
MYAILSYVIVLGHSPVGLVSLAAIVALGRVCKLTMDPRHSSIRLFRKAASELLCKHALVVFFTTWKFIGKMYEWEEELGDGIDKRKRSDVADHLCARDHCQGDGEL